MATFKHISSKNADYGAAEAYLTFEHDEFTMKPTLDENGRLIPREDYRISSLNCGGEDFAVACMRANLRYEKNQKREDVKSHHYIISFDPRDGTDNGLTVDRAQELGEQFCKEHFPGHQALADVLCVPLRHDVDKGRKLQRVGFLAVYAVVDCNKAHVVPSEYLHSVADLEIVAPPARQVFHNADTDFPVFYIVHHAGIGGTVKKPAAFVIVDIVPDIRQL